MIIFPNAKINLGLNIIKKREDNFHELDTVFYPIPWLDALEIIPSDNFEFSASGIHIDGTSDNNLCSKVFKSLKEKYGIPEIKIHLHKNIPIGAGLGGGSSDAAFTLKLLKKIFDLGLTENEMEDIVRPLGSDCAFFIRNKVVYAYGKGDQFENIPLKLSGKFIVLIYPDLHISTKEAYDGVKPQTPELNIKEILQKDIREWKGLLVNDFEKTIFPKYPLLKEIKEKLYQQGALYASMSGSGSTVFGIFEEPITIANLFPLNYKIQTGTLE